MSRKPDAKPRPRIRVVPRAHSNDADDAIFLATGYNLAPDAWQADILYGWLGRRADGKWCAGRCGLAVPRQNGKNGAIEIRELYGMIELGEAFLHTAHEVKTARKAFKRLKHFFGEKANDPGARYPELNALVREVRSTNGQEAIFLHDICESCFEVIPQCQCGERKIRRGGSVEFVARSNGSGRGYTVDVLILDEAQHLEDDELEAIRSAVSSAPLGNPQVIYTGTPPNREKGQQGEVFARIRAGAVNPRTGEQMKSPKPRLCWIEYGAPDGPLPDIDDIDLLYEVNPALGLRHANGAYGLTMDVVRDERDELSPEGYARERYGWWGDPHTKNRGVISLKDWATCRIPDPGPPKRVEVVVDVAPDLDWASIGLAGAGPLDRVLILEHHDAGTGWVIAKLLEVLENVEAIEVALTPTAQLFAPALDAAEVEYHQLTNPEVGRACSAFQEWVKNGTVCHIGQTELDRAVQNARTRFVGDVQHWDQRDRSIDLTPLRATSVAAQRWVMHNAKPTKPPPPPRGIDTGEFISGGFGGDWAWLGGGSDINSIPL